MADGSGTPADGNNHVAASITLMVGAVAALGTGITSLAVTGSIGRVQRNHPTWFAIAIGLVVAASACWLIAAALARQDATPADDGTKPSTTGAKPATKGQNGGGGSRWQRRLAVGGIALAGIGVVLGFLISVNTAGEPERPIVSLRLDPTTLTLSGTAKVSRLSSEEPLTVTIDGMVRNGAKLVVTQRLAEASVGPDSDGNANEEILVHIPPGQFDVVGVRATTKDDQKPADQCGSYPTVPPDDDDKGGVVSNVADDQKPVASTSMPAGTDGIQTGLPTDGTAAAPEVKKTRAGTGCQYVSLPPPTLRPPLTRRWVGAGRRTLLVTATTPNAIASGAKRPLLHMDVVAFDGKRVTVLERVVRDPAAPGQAIAPLRISVPASARTVCAWASLDAKPLIVPTPCPLSKGMEQFKGNGAAAFEVMGPAAFRSTTTKKKAR
jgi:hypothetical protein